MELSIFIGCMEKNQQYRELIECMEGKKQKSKEGRKEGKADGRKERKNGGGKEGRK